MKIDLSRFTIGEKQTSGVMSIYPILGEDAKFSLASFNDISFDGTCDYGTMVFSNKSENPFIIPSGYAIVTKQEAQDHGLPNAEYLDGDCRKRKIYSACCIQETQCGYITPVSAKDFRYLPLDIRKSYLKDEIYNRDTYKSFSRLWEYIYSFQQSLVNKSDSNLVFFFDKYMKKLASFNAEFENVEGQIGAIILLNNEIVGIEIAPSKEYWSFIWKSLIRDCYGAEVIRRIEKDMVSTFKDSLENIEDFSSCENLNDIISYLDSFNKQQLEKGLKILSDIGDISFSYNSNKEFKDKLNYCKIYDENIVGEVFNSEDNELVYLSLLF